MKTTAKIFVVAIMIPAVVLGLMAFNAAMRQEEVILRQEAQILQSEVDSWVFQVNEYIESQLEGYESYLESLMSESDIMSVAEGFELVASS